MWYTYCPATVSGYGRYKPNRIKWEKAKFRNFSRNGSGKDFNIIVN
jgi:hypothetical protein